MSSTFSAASAVSARPRARRNANRRLLRDRPLLPRVLASTGPTFPAMTTCEPSPPNDSPQMELLLMSSAAGFPARISASPERARALRASGGLWSEYARIIGEVRPRYVIVENVAALLGRGLARVLGDLAALGYDAEWHCIPASAVGAPHRRDRIWIIAYASSSIPVEREAMGENVRNKAITRNTARAIYRQTPT